MAWILCSKRVISSRLAGLLEVVAERVQVGGLDRDAGFETDVGGLVALRKEAPAGLKLRRARGV